jgi:hypothetical protein
LQDSILEVLEVRSRGKEASAGEFLFEGKLEIVEEKMITFAHTKVSCHLL